MWIVGLWVWCDGVDFDEVEVECCEVVDGCVIFVEVGCEVDWIVECEFYYGVWCVGYVG